LLLGARALLCVGVIRLVGTVQLEGVVKETPHTGGVFIFSVFAAGAAEGRHVVVRVLPLIYKD
jgi:hypothetical protein